MSDLAHVSIAVAIAVQVDSKSISAS
jgi:hypothetical protein